MELQARVDRIRKDGMGLIAISYDPVPVLAEFSARRGITFPLLSDAGSATIKRYGLLNTTLQESSPMFGVPFPGTFILDRRAVVTARFFEQAYQERNTITSVIARLGGRVDAPATRISAPHLEITSFTTDQAASPGTRFSLVLDIRPAPRVHVYAPGVSGYKPIALTVRPQAGLIVNEVHLPNPEDYFFKPLNEHVPVFGKPFRLMQDVMLDPSRDAADVLRNLKSMEIGATLTYQACDDKVCFTPQDVPLSWTIAVKPLDRDRAKQP